MLRCIIRLSGEGSGRQPDNDGKDYGSRRDVEKWVPFALTAVLVVGCLVTGVVFATAWTPT